MKYAESIDGLQARPEDKRAEVFDFVAYPANRFTGSGNASEWTDEEFGRSSLRQALRGLEEFEGTRAVRRAGARFLAGGARLRDYGGVAGTGSRR